jgi:hypothetical protein
MTGEGDKIPPAKAGGILLYTTLLYLSNLNKLTENK